jgi:hypothetical protein
MRSGGMIFHETAHRHNRLSLKSEEDAFDADRRG